MTRVMAHVPAEEEEEAPSAAATAQVRGNTWFTQ
jgi:hypothetical protein